MYSYTDYVLHTRIILAYYGYIYITHTPPTHTTNRPLISKTVRLVIVIHVCACFCAIVMSILYCVYNTASMGVRSVWLKKNCPEYMLYVWKNLLNYQILLATCQCVTRIIGIIQCGSIIVVIYVNT